MAAGRRVRGKVNLKTRAGTRGIGYFNCAAMEFHEFLGDGQAQSRAAKAARRTVVSLPEGFEDNLAPSRQNTRSAVLHDEFHQSGLGGQSEMDLAAGRSELEGVREQIEENPL